MKAEYIAFPGRILRISQHILFWLGVLAFYTITFGSRDQNYLRILLQMLITLPLDMAVTYFHIYFLIPRFLLKKKYLSFAGLFVVTAMVILVIEAAVNRYIAIPLLWPGVLKEGTPFFNFAWFYLLIEIYTVVLGASVIKLVRHWLRSEQQRTMLELQNKASELALLRSQINPHFLFNTLNNIDTLINIDPGQASVSIHRLSEIMRYMIYEADREFVPLFKEISYLQTFIELHLLRLKNRELVEFNIEGDPGQQLIAPMMLVPFIENAFKHVDKNATSPAIRIRIDIFPRTLVMNAMNSYKPIEDISNHESNGIGLSNVKRRLLLLYPDQHELIIQSANNIFSVHLRINFK